VKCRGTELTLIGSQGSEFSPELSDEVSDGFPTLSSTLLNELTEPQYRHEYDSNMFRILDRS
jgi:hypothetical protein